MATDTTHHPLLEVEDLVVGYGKATVVHGVSFHIRAGERIAMLGRNGAGKSTTLLALSGLIPKRSGKVLFNGVDITAASAREIVEAGFVHVLQDHRVFGPLSVEDNLLVSLMPRDRKNPRQLLDHVYGVFPELAEKRQEPAAGLSGGQQQMLAIGQGMAARPKLLMLDEPSCGLAPVMVDRIFEVAKQLSELGVSVLIVEQLVTKTLNITDRCYVMAGGKITHAADSDDLKDGDTIRRLYLG